MLRMNQTGSIIGLIIGIIAIAFIFFTLTNYWDSSSTDSDGDGQNDSTIIDQAKDGTRQAEEAGQKANSLIDGLTGN